MQSGRSIAADHFVPTSFARAIPTSYPTAIPFCACPRAGEAQVPTGSTFSVVGWDPAVTEAGVDAGYSPEPDVLRALDIAVGNVPDKPGWIPGAPVLAVEYADVGQDEDKLQEKIEDLLEAGTRFLWVVRLAGPRRVEVHESGKKLRVVLPGEELTAPGVLKNAVRVEALYDRGEAEQVTLRNLLQRQGYQDLEAVLARGREEGELKGRDRILRQLRVRFGELPESVISRVNAPCSEELDVWAEVLLSAKTLDAVFAGR